MKKIALIISFILISATAGFSQLATAALQTAGNATLVNMKKSADTLNQYTRLQATAALQTAGNATLVNIKKSADTLNQYARLQATSALQTAANATLVNIKKSADTLNQYGRLQATASLQTTGNATLTLLKQKMDTLNQYTRLQSTAAAQAINTTSVSLVKKGIDTLNQYIRALKLVVDSINQVDKFKTVAFSYTSSNSGVVYAAGDVIFDDGAQAFSVSVGSGNWEVVQVVMYPTSSSSALDVNLSLFTATINPGTDNNPFNSSTTYNAGYAGTMGLGVRAPFTGSEIYSSRARTGSSSGDPSIFLKPTNGAVWLLLTANSAFTPPADEIYNIKLFLKKLN